MMNIKSMFYSKLDELSVDEIPAEWWLERFRNWRNLELKNSDWTQLGDSSADKDAWAIYRQALRDLPAKKNFANVEIPERPI